MQLKGKAWLKICCAKCNKIESRMVFGRNGLLAPIDDTRELNSMINVAHAYHDRALLCDNCYYRYIAFITEHGELSLDAFLCWGRTDSVAGLGKGPTCIIPSQATSYTTSDADAAPRKEE